jgi:hypothetical protein
MMKGTFQIAGLKSRVLPNFRSLYGLKYPYKTQVRPSLQLQESLWPQISLQDSGET